MSKLSEVLDKLRGTLSYRDLDMKSLDMSRKTAAGNLSDNDYAQWAAITDDPYVSIDLVKTYIRTFKSKLSNNPFRPKDDETWAIGELIHLNEQIESGLESTMEDGFTYYAVGVNNGFPIVVPLDARYVIHDGSEPTLKDCKNLVTFRIEPLSFEEMEKVRGGDNYPSEFVTYDPTCEKVITSHYHKKNITEESINEFGMPVHTKKSVWVLDTYETYDSEPKTTIIPNVDRCPVVRFVGERVELKDKKYHYRGLYWTMGSLQKAFQLAATKMQSRVATEDDANYIADTRGLNKDVRQSWSGVGVREYDGSDLNGGNIDAPIPIHHDNQFLLATFNAWQGCINMMLSPLAQSGSEAVTEEEVKARNEVRDAIAASFLRPAQNTISEIYRLIRSLVRQDTSPVVIVSGFLENEKRLKEKGELHFIYGLAKESGLNAQGIVQMMVDKSDLDATSKAQIKQSFMQDPYASPVVVQLKTQIQQLQNTIQTQNQQMAILKLQASQRMERQAEYTAMQERVKRAEIEFKYWKEEQTQTQQGFMELLKSLLQNGDVNGAIGVIERMAQTAPSPLATGNDAIDAYTEETRSMMESNPQAQLAKVEIQNENPTMQMAIQQQQQIQNRQQLQQNLAQRAQVQQLGG